MDNANMDSVTNTILDNIQQQNYEIIRQNEKLIQHLAQIRSVMNLLCLIIFIHILGILILFIMKFQTIMNLFDELSNLI